MLKRQREGIAKAQGRNKGHLPTIRRKGAEIVRVREAGVRLSETASRLGIGRASSNDRGAGFSGFLSQFVE
jgi:hypothetical protein